MRIALVVQGGFHCSGREEVVPALLWLVERMARRHEVHVVALRHGRAPACYPLVGATVHDLGGGALPPGRGLLHLLPALRSVLRRAGPFDVIHGYRGAPGAAAALAGRWLGAPSVSTLDGGELVALPQIGYGLTLSWRGRIALATALRLSTRLTVCTRHMGALLRERGHTTDEIPLGVDRRRFGPASPPPSPPWRLLSVASLSRVKDHETLLESMRLVIRRLPEVVLDVAGQDTLAGEVQRRCTQLGLDGHVRFHGFRPNEDLAALYHGAHLNVVSSRHEAACVAVLEAAACGVPTVGTAVGYVADWAPERAWAVPVGDADALSAGILALLADGPRRERMGRAAEAWARCHDADWTASRFEDLYGQVIEAS